MHQMSVDEAKAWLKKGEFVEWGEWFIGLLQPGEDVAWLKAVNGLRCSLDGSDVSGD